MAKGYAAGLLSDAEGDDMGESIGDEFSEDVDSGHEAKVAAMRSMFEAMQAGDFDAAADAFQTAYEACMEAKSEPMPEDEGGGLGAALLGE